MIDLNVASNVDLVKNSSLYREFQAERDEIMRHKWIESEKAGYDIGFEHALTDWIIKHRSKWRRSRQYIQATSIPTANPPPKENHDLSATNDARSNYTETAHTP